MEDKNKDVIDLRIVLRKVREHKMLFAKVLPVVFVASCLIALSIPRYYTTEVKIVPELDNSMPSGGGLASIASSFGFDLSDMQTSDAISPLLYPDLMEDNGFVAKLFPIRVKDSEGEIDTDYFTYLKKHQKSPWWSKAIEAVKKLITTKKIPSAAATANAGNPYYLSKEDEGVASKIRDNISLAFDKKTTVITISVTDQDPAICKSIADSIQTKLQAFITDYRTSKARTDVAYYEQLSREAKASYDSIRVRYARMSDANQDLILMSIKTQLEDMENEMQLRYNAYSTMNVQLQAAKAKVQQRTPAFTTIEGARYPNKHAGPKRMLGVAAMLVLACMGLAVWVIRKDIIEQLKSSK